MNITVNNVRENALDKTVFFTLTDDSAVEYKGTTDIPLTVEDEQTFCDANIKRLLLFYRRKEYRKADLSEIAGDTELEKFETWIAAGHTNPAHCSKNEHETEQECIDAECTWIPAEVIEKVPFTGAHPDVFPSSGAEKTNLAAAAKNLAGNLTFSQVDSYIDTEFSNLSAAQRMFLKKQAKAVLFLLKRGN